MTAMSPFRKLEERMKKMPGITAEIVKLEDDLAGATKRYLDAVGELDRDSRSTVIEKFENRMNNETPHLVFDFDPAWIAAGNQVGRPSAV